MSKKKTVFNTNMIVGGTIASLTMGAGVVLAMNGESPFIRAVGLATCAGGMALAATVIEDDFKNRVIPQLNELMYDAAAIGVSHNAPPVIDTTED